MARLLLRVLTPAREVVSREVDAATLMAEQGEVGILPGHAALLTALRPGILTCRDGAEEHRLAHSDGFLEVRDDVITALVRSAERADEIDVARAEARRAERERELGRQDLSEHEMRVAALSLQKQMARLTLSRR